LGAGISVGNNFRRAAKQKIIAPGFSPEMQMKRRAEPDYVLVADNSGRLSIFSGVLQTLKDFLFIRCADLL